MIPSQRPEVKAPVLLGEISMDRDGRLLSIPEPVRDLLLRGDLISEAIPELPWVLLAPEHIGAQTSLLLFREGRVRDVVVQLLDGADGAAPEKNAAAHRLVIRERDPLVAYGTVGETYMVVTERILAELAHDLNNPVTGVLAALDTLLEFETLSTDATDLLKGARAEVLRLAELTRRAQTRVKNQPISFELTEVNMLFANAAQPMQRDFARRKLNARVELPEQQHLFRLDPSAVRAMLLTLLLNAMDAMERTGGEIRIVVALREQVGKPSFVEVQVIDRGPGMPPDELVRAGDLLFTTRRGGAGVGLLVLRRLAIEHGGAIALRSVVGEGTRATLVLGAPAGSSSVHG